MKNSIVALALLFALSCSRKERLEPISWPEHLPVYDHVVIVMEENKDYEQVLRKEYAPYINDVLKREGANFTRMYGEEHNSQGNYFWLFSGDNQNVGFDDAIPGGNSYHGSYPFVTSNLAYQLIRKGRTFRGYAEDLPAVGSTVSVQGLYARKHVPWISFGNIPAGNDPASSCNLRFQDFPEDYSKLPTVSFVIPNLDNDMHNCNPSSCPGKTAGDRISCCVRRGDDWLKKNIDSYYRWAKKNNSLLILTFDESDDKSGYRGLTNPLAGNLEFEHSGGKRFCKDSVKEGYCADLENRIVTIFAGAHIKAGDYTEKKGITHVNILRTLEAMYGLSKSGAQQKNAAGLGIRDDYIITDVFEPVK